MALTVRGVQTLDCSYCDESLHQNKKQRVRVHFCNISPSRALHHRVWLRVGA